MKKKIIILSCIIVLCFTTLFIINEDNKKTIRTVKDNQTDQLEVNKVYVDESNIEEQTIEETQEQHKDSNDSSEPQHESSNNNYVAESIESNSEIPTSNNSSSNDYNVKSYEVVEQKKEKTAWEILGISEYDYYNTPNDNEGELAFIGDTSLCKNEINRLVNTYYDDGIDGGNYFTINGKYTYSYLGCGINMFINGKSYTYNQIKSMGFI